MSQICTRLFFLLILFVPSLGQAGEKKPLLIQGPMPIEVNRLLERLAPVQKETVGPWTFWRATLGGYPIVISKTGKGIANTAAATAVAIEHYHPAAIINQGTAGGHDPELKVFDIVLGKDTVNIGAFKTTKLGAGAGSNSLTWQPMDVLFSEGSAGENPDALKMRRFAGDPGLLSAARIAKGHYKKSRVVEGTIASSEVWDSELDRIHRFHGEFQTSAEEMEGASGAQVASLYQTPFLGIRILSNNITNGGHYDATTAASCQDFVYEVAKAFVSGR